MVDGGQCDSPQIGPWTQWQGDLDADLMVVGQDWGDVRYFRDNRGLDKAGNPTNLMLAKLLLSIGMSIGSVEHPDPHGRVFLTKAGAPSSVPRSSW